MAAVAVVLALMPCAASRADECARRFDQLTTGLPDACVFIGRVAGACGDEAVALFAGDGDALVVSLATPAAAVPFFLPAQALSATEGKLVLWRPDLDLARAASVGVVRLEGGGRRLVVRFTRPVPTPSGCPLSEFTGEFAGMTTSADPPAAPRPIAAPAARPFGVRAAAHGAGSGG